MSATSWPLQSAVTPREPDHPNQLTVPRAIVVALLLPEYDDPEPEPDADDRQDLDALVAGLTLHEPQRNGDADRVVGETETCDCGRPAGADGLCEYHRREHAGETIGNHGGRL